MTDLPDPKLMAPLKAVPVDDALNDWLVAYQTGNSGVDGKDWAIVTDRVNASAFYYLEFPGDAKEDAETIVSILMAYRSGSLTPRSEYERVLALLADARADFGRVRDEALMGVSHGLGDRVYSISSGALSRIDDALAADAEARG